MQTPLQIANDVVDKHLGIRPAGTLVTFALSLEQIRDMIVEGVESDQEQRKRKRKQPTCKHCGLPVRPAPDPDTGLPDWIHLATRIPAEVFDCGLAQSAYWAGTIAEVAE